MGDYDSDPRLTSVESTISMIDYGYVMYIKTHDFEDSPLLRGGYYHALELINAETPLPDADLQFVVSKHIQRRIKESDKELLCWLAEDPRNVESMMTHVARMIDRVKKKDGN